MIAHLTPQLAPSSPTNTDVFTRFCAFYRQRQDAFNLIKQLAQIIKAAQRHRGMSMALLGGNELFRDDFNHLQQQLERRLIALQAFASGTQNLFSQRDQENLRNAWVTISRDWQEDSVIDNYELHCHLIEQLLGMLATLAKLLEQPVSVQLYEHMNGAETSAPTPQHPHRFKHLEVLHFSTRLMPAVVEQIGRIRALSSYAAALGYCDNHHDVKLRYVIQCTKVNNEKLRHQARRLETILQGDLSILGQLKSYEIKLMFLLDMIEGDVLGNSKITADSSRLFSLATDIIDTYLRVIDEGINLFMRWNEEDLETWLQTV